MKFLEEKSHIILTISLIHLCYWNGVFLHFCFSNINSPLRAYIFIFLKPCITLIFDVVVKVNIFDFSPDKITYNVSHHVVILIRRHCDFYLAKMTHLLTFYFFTWNFYRHPLLKKRPKDWNIIINTLRVINIATPERNESNKMICIWQMDIISPWLDAFICDAS